MNIKKDLFSLKDEKYASFQSKLVPTVPKENFIGVKVPLLRKLAKKYCKDPELPMFMKTLPHYYYEENMLHVLLLNNKKDYFTLIKNLGEFLPYVNNWAICDGLSPVIFKKHKEELIVEIKKWLNSEHIYTRRFALRMLMIHFLENNLITNCLKLALSTKIDDYYLETMLAWLLTEALAKNWEATIIYLERGNLPYIVQNKTIQKACESLKIKKEKKLYLKNLKILYLLFKK